MDEERYQGYTIRSEPGRPGGAYGVWWFNVERGEQDAFRVEMRFSWMLAATASDRTEAMPLAEEYGRHWVHGLIDLGRFEQGKTYKESRTTENWNPVSGEESVSDEDLRRELLQALRRMHRAQQGTSAVLDLDVLGIAAVLGVRVERVREVLSELILEELAEPFAEAMGHIASDGRCRVTGKGLEELRRIEHLPARSPVSAAAGTKNEPSQPGLEIFIAYSHKDKTYRDRLEAHLSALRRQGVISVWHDRRIGAGKHWGREIDEHLCAARVILLLVSADFIASNYCYETEMIQAMERHESGEALVIPIILRSCDWKPLAFGKLQALPTDAKPVANWSRRDDAYADIAKGIREAADRISK